VTTAARVHPDFEAVPENRRWRGNPNNLWHCLNLSARASPKGKAWVVLASGMLVALRIRENGQRELTLSRSGNDRTESEWAAEVIAFKRLTVTTGWKCEPDDTVKSGRRVILTETECAQDFFQEAGKDD
jgi:hypothetical protein